MVTRLVKIFENLKNNRQYFMLSSLRGSVGFPGCLKRPFKVSELEHSVSAFLATRLFSSLLLGRPVLHQQFFFQFWLNIIQAFSCHQGTH
ncbi:hypothetical protein NC653_037625 [Populus alba x Populus x berolinensis]|uniref:Uncharacterized protein n=1 Tax=Populus alba x Populus x berolinensis TaxID=444605 RepID=A0AAD6LFB9_9ROSI|nr:hypothetical protein NC653_037625 [Populus alba x Populus x berolinensis]